jgi:carboxyl-terminal processing protease
VKRNHETKEITVIRGKITVPALTLEWKQGIPVIGLHNFKRDTGSELEKLVETDILPRDPHSLIIDLRNNPGGFLTAANEIGELFADTAGELGVETEHRQKSQRFVSSRKGPLSHLNRIIILQNKGTASASEILITYLQDKGIATTIGMTTVGKGTVQEVINYSNGSALKLTVAKWLSPKGRWLDQKEGGIKPDIEIPAPTSEQKKADVDPQLDRAIREAQKRF